MNRKKSPIYLGIAIAIGILLGSLLNFKNSATSFFKTSTQETKIKRLINYIQYDYVDNVDTDKMLDDAINTIVRDLDPHSVYFTKKELAAENEKMQGNFHGIGVQFLIHKDTVVITKVLDKGPSIEAGIKAGDRILLANNDTLSGWGLKRTNKFVVSTLKGNSKTKVNLTIYRPSLKKNIEFNIERGEVPITSVSKYYMLNNTVGIIKVDRFAEKTYDEFKKALDTLVNQGMQTLLLDLRDNPGGYMKIAIKIVDEFLGDKKLIVFTKDKKGEVEKDFATKKGDFEKNKIYILINENSASASEIVAGALQDNDKGTIIGRRSFGKGLVQQVLDLGDGSAVRLTIARYYTPTGRSIQKPYNLNESDNYFSHFKKRFERGELTNIDSVKTVDSLKYVTPKGKVVYGGGGIVPDVFVPIDTTQFINNKYTEKLSEFSFNYVDKNRTKLEKLSSEDFISMFDKDDKIVNDYLKILNHKKPISKHTKNIIKNYLITGIAGYLFDDTNFYKITHKDDKMIEKALELEKER